MLTKSARETLSQKQVVPVWVEIRMRGGLILLVFFSLFTCASLLIPSPMFPGSSLCVLFGTTASEYYAFLSALLNGVFYGVLLWLVFAAVSRRLGQEK